MQFNVTIEKALPEQGGTSKSGKQWRKRSYVGVYDASNAQYPKRITFDVMGDRIEQLNIQEGGQYVVDVDFDAREWQGRYFLSASCWKATALNQTQASLQFNDTYAAMGMQPKQAAPEPEPNDLPF